MGKLLSWEVHALRGDATNSSSWRSKKVYSSEITSVFHVPTVALELPQAAPELDLDGYDSMRRSYPDLTFVP